MSCCLYFYEEEYVRYFQDDIARSVKLIQENVGCDVYALAYPGGASSERSEQLCKEAGIKVTLLGGEGANSVIEGDPDCLYSMARNDITEQVSAADLVQMLKDAES